MSVVAEHRLPGLVCVDHRFELPLDHGAPDGPRLTVAAREVRAPGDAAARRPWLVFLQGGPGCPAPRPSEAGGWIGRAVRQFRVLLLGQRGTGLSTPICHRALQPGGALALLAGDDRALADHLACFRADAIVADCEAIRAELCGDRPWVVLGQSFGGFCATHYLSAAPQGLAAALITGGLPPLDLPAEEVYRRTYPLVEQRNRQHFERFPGDRARLDALAARLARGDVRLPDGDVLSLRRVLQAGLQLGMSDGSAALHHLLEQALPWGDDGPVGEVFLRGLEAATTLTTQPIFSLLHEACYAQGGPTAWAAQRVRDEFPAFALDGSVPPLFSGEMIYPWQFEEYATLRPFAGAAELLAHKADWPALYDRDVLTENRVPVAAAVYHDDMYVHREPSLATAAAIPRVSTWITNAYEHNGLRADGARVLDQLLARLADLGWVP